jgi:hypothetical protein
MTRMPRSASRELCMACLARLLSLDGLAVGSLCIHAGAHGAEARSVDGQGMVLDISLSPRAKNIALRDDTRPSDCMA